MSLCQIDWTAIAAIALVIVTAYYAWSTHRILKESQKSREATQSLAESSKESLKLLEKEREESLALSKATVQTAIQSSMSKIISWNVDCISFYADRGTIPNKIDLGIFELQAAMNHSIKFSTDLPPILFSAVDHLSLAQIELDQLRADLSKSLKRREFMNKCISNYKDFLQEAEAELKDALKIVQRLGIPVMNN